MKRMTAILLTVIMVLSLCCGTAFAETPRQTDEAREQRTELLAETLAAEVTAVDAGFPDADPPADGDGAGQASIVTGSLKTDAGLFALAAAVVAVLVGFVLGLGPVPAVIVVLLTFVTTIMSAQSCGQTGIDPMEIFGLIVLLVVAALGQSTQVQLFFVAGIVAVACGLAGDVMNDFKAGHMLGTDARAQWLGQALGGVLGADESADKGSFDAVRDRCARSRR